MVIANLFDNGTRSLAVYAKRVEIPTFRPTPIREVMRHGDELRVAVMDESVRGTLQRLRSSGRRTGAVLITDEQGVLCGVFTYCHLYASTSLGISFCLGWSYCRYLLCLISVNRRQI